MNTENYSNEINYDENGILVDDWDVYYANEVEQQSLEQESLSVQQEFRESLNTTNTVYNVVGLSIVVSFLIALLILVISNWKIYKKARKPGWAAIIPIYSDIVMLEICCLPIWMIIIALFVSPVYLIMVCFNLAKKFNKSTGFAIGLILLPLIFYPILAFGKSQYESESNNADLPNNNDNINNEINNDINSVNKNNNEVRNNQEILNNELGFVPSVSDIENNSINLQPNLGIDSNQLNQNINDDLINNMEQDNITPIISESIINNESDLFQYTNDVQNSNIEDETENNNDYVENNIDNSNVVNPSKLDNSLVINSNELNNFNNDVNNGKPSLNILDNIKYNDETVNVTNQQLFNEEITNNDVLENDNNIENINNSVELDVEKPLSFNTLTKKQEVIEKELKNLDKVEGSEFNEILNNNSDLKLKELSENVNSVNINNEGNICTNCGNKCNSGDMFCVNCGNKLN